MAYFEFKIPYSYRFIDDNRFLYGEREGGVTRGALIWTASAHALKRTPCNYFVQFQNFMCVSLGVSRALPFTFCASQFKYIF